MSMFYIGIVMTSISAHIQVESSRGAAKAAEKTAAYNANEKRKQAVQEMAVAGENARRKQGENQRLLAQLRSASAASGMTMEGSPLAVFGDTALQLERDILDLSFDAENRRRALLAGAALDETEGANQASALRTQGLASAAGTVASGAVSAGNAAGWFAPKAAEEKPSNSAKKPGYL